MSSESKPVPQIIRESWPHFAYFHANDKNLKGPGFGDVDFKPIAAALKEAIRATFRWWLQVEEGAETIATRSVEYLKRVRASRRKNGTRLAWRGSLTHATTALAHFRSSGVTRASVESLS
jgi:hypothetical protein